MGHDDEDGMAELAVADVDGELGWTGNGVDPCFAHP